MSIAVHEREQSRSRGAPLTLADGLGSAPVSWGPDNHILGSFPGGILRVPASGGKPQTLATTDGNKGEVGYQWTEWSAERRRPFGRDLLPPLV